MSRGKSAVRCRHSAADWKQEQRSGKDTEEGHVAKNTGKGRRTGAVTGRSQVKNPTSGLWTKRNTSSGQFVAVKKSGDVFKGVRKEN